MNEYKQDSTVNLIRSYFSVIKSTKLLVCRLLFLLNLHRRSQDIVWGCTFSYQKSWRPFFPNLTSPAKTVLKLTPALAGGGVLRVCPMGVHLHISPVNYAWNFFSPPSGVQVHPLHPLATPMWPYVTLNECLRQKTQTIQHEYSPRNVIPISDSLYWINTYQILLCTVHRSFSSN